MAEAPEEIDPLFQVHMLNETGITKAKAIAKAFSRLLVDLGFCDVNGGREGAIVRTKLEEAAFFAKKAMASQLGNQKG